jgi:pyruvate kinase
VAEGADYLAASYVGEASHVEAVRAVVLEAGGRIPIIAKIERKTAIEKLEEITDAADGLMVARGDLGVEVPLYTVPVLQKKIVAAGRLSGKPVIVATQMLESMVEQPRPTRAEATDVANAVFDGADALMLSGETAAGKYPVLVVETMARIIQEAEDYARESNNRPALAPLGHIHARRSFALDPDHPDHPGQPDQPGQANPPDAAGAEPSLDIPDIVSAAAVLAASQIGVSRIVAFSQSGFTARLVARYRPPSPIMAFTPDARVARQLQLVWGVRPFVAEFQVGSLDDIVQVVERELLAARLVQPGDLIIILMGHPVRERPLTNLMRVHRIRPV